MPTRAEKRAVVAAYIWEFTKKMAVYLAVLLVAIAIIDLIAGLRTLFQFADSLFLAGGLVVTVGAASTFGHWGQDRSYQQQFARSVSAASLEERTQQQVYDDEQAYSFASLAIFSGFMLCLLSIVIHQFI